MQKAQEPLTNPVQTFTPFSPQNGHDGSFEQDPDSTEESTTEDVANQTSLESLTATSAEDNIDDNVDHSEHSAWMIDSVKDHGINVTTKEHITMHQLGTETGRRSQRNATGDLSVKMVVIEINSFWMTKVTKLLARTSHPAFAENLCFGAAKVEMQRYGETRVTCHVLRTMAPTGSRPIQRLQSQNREIS